MFVNNRILVIGSISLIVLAGLVAYGGMTRAQASVPAHTQTAQTIAPGAIPVQGRLTDASGAPLNGVYTTTFRLYDAAAAVIAICSDIRPVTVTNGLFNDLIDHCYDDINGQKLWLGVQVLDDAEMLPRQVIYPVPYALTLRPGAVISSSSSTALKLNTTSNSGSALIANAVSDSGTNYGVYATSSSPEGYAGYFYNGGSGTGVWAVSVAGTALQVNSLGTGIRTTSGTGAALAAEGTGRITSTAKSYVWISGNGVRPYTTTMRIDMDSIGGAKVYRNGGSGTRNVMLPITVMGPLYGQDVRVTAMDISWVGDTEFDGITAVLLRRQTGVCATCYASIINDHPVGGLSCEDSINLAGCVRHYDATTNNVLTSDSGVLYLTLELTFSSDTTWVEIGGVRLTLVHK